MLSMKEKTFVGIVVLFVAVVTASVVIPVTTFQVKLVTSPEEDATYVPAGKPFNITCEGLGDDDGKLSSMRWLDKEGNVIQEKVPGVQKVGQNAITLIFTFPKISQSGVYKCSAVYGGKHTLEKSIRIIFYGPKPTFESYFENMTAKEGSTLEIDCSAVGEKPISYEWYQDEDKITENSTSIVFVRNTGNVSTLVIQKVGRNHEAMYTCSARNEHGLSSKVYQLTILSSSDEGTNDNGTSSIIKVEARNITSTSVNFFIVVTGSLKAIEVKFREMRDDTERSMQWKYGYNFEVKDLIPSGQYTFRFRAVSSENGTWSKLYTVTLLPDKPEIIFHKVMDDNVKLEWFVKVDDVMRGTIDAFELKYFTVRMEKGNSWVPSNCAITVQLPTGCAGRQYTIAGLSQEQYYEIQVRAHTVSGYGEASKLKIFLRR